MQVQKGKITGIIRSPYTQSLFKRYLPSYIVGIAFLIIVDFMQTRVPLVTGGIIDGLAENRMGAAEIGHNVALLFVIAAFIITGRIVWRFCIFGTSRKIERDIRNDMFAHLEKMSQSYYHQHKTGDLMAHMTNDLEAVRNALGGGVLRIVDFLALSSFTLFNMVTTVDAKLTAIVAIPMVFIAITVYGLMGRLYRRFAEKQAAFADMYDYVQETFSGIRVVKAFVQEENEKREFTNVNSNNYDKNMNFVKLQAFMDPFMSLVMGTTMAIAIGYGGYIAVNGRITVGDFSAFIQYLGMLVWPMISSGMMLNTFTMGSVSIERIERILHETPQIRDEEGTCDMTAFEGSIEVKNLTFRYPGADRCALRNVSFSVDKGQTLGIVGRTGSGKTTVVDLMLRVFDPDRGTVFIGGTDIRDIPLKTLRENIGYVPQDNFLFSDTVAHNIDFSKGSSSEEEIEAAAREACVHDNITEFAKGYNTVVGERGVSLSGGQKQRIAIARALIKRPEILILDDSVSAVDTDTEEKILRHFEEERGGKTNIIIAHRISTLQKADRIIVIEDGQITDSGTHDELIARDGLYKSLYEKQLLEKMTGRE